MAADTSRSIFRGIAVLDPRSITSAAIASEFSTYDQAGPLAGIPEDQDDSSIVWEAVGTQTAGSELRLRTHNGGFPGGDNGARFIRQRNGDSDWLGWNAPQAIDGYEYLVNAGYNPTAVTLENGDVLAVYNGSSISTINYQLRTASTNTWGSSQSILSTTTWANLTYSHCDVIVIPPTTKRTTERVIVFYLVESDQVATEVQIDAKYSDDSGTTWQDYAKHCIKTETFGDALDTDDYAFHRLRAQYNPATEEILLLVWGEHTSATHSSHLLQYASRDMGATFEHVVSIDGADTDDQSITGDVVLTDGVYVVISANPSTNAAVNGHESWRLSSAFQPVSAGGSGDTFAVSNIQIDATVGDNKFCACVDDLGWIWAYTSNTDPTVNNFHAMYSTDGAQSWETCHGGNPTTGYGSWYQPGVATVHPVEMACTWQRGRVLMLSQQDSPTTTSDDGSLTALYLGGWTGVTRPYRQSSLTTTVRTQRTPAFQAGWELDWIPFELPGNDGWTKSSTGTATESIASGLLALTTTGVSKIAYYYDVSTITDTSHAWTATGAVQVTSGQSDVLLQWDDNTNTYVIGIQVSSTTIDIVDTPAGSPPVVQDTDTHGGGAVEFIMAMRGSAVEVWWRDLDTSSEKSWTKMSATAGAGPTPNGTSRAQFGIREEQTSAATWHRFSIAAGAGAGAGIEGFTNPDDLIGHAIGSGPQQAVWIGDGVRGYTIDGPTAAGEDFHVDTRYTYPIERIMPGTSPSPRHVWRSSSTTAEMAIAWERSSFTSESSRALQGPEVIHLRNVNFRQAMLGRTQNGISWTDEVEIINYESAVFTRKGNIVYPGLGTAADAPYYQENELAGGYFEFPNGTVRKITSNTAGNWVVGTTDAQLCAIYCEDIDDSEDASGTGEIWFPNITVIVSPYNAVAFRLEINQDSTPTNPPEGYFQVGSLFHGRVIPFHCDYSFGRVVTREPNTEILTARDGTRRTRVNGPTRRRVQVAWEGVLVGDYAGTGEPEDTFEWNATYNSHVAHDEPLKLDGLIEYLNGPDLPVLYLPRLDKFSGADGNVQYNYQRNRGAIYGRIVSPLTVTSIRGEEEEDESLAVAALVIEEEI